MIKWCKKLNAGHIILLLLGMLGGFWFYGFLIEGLSVNLSKGIDFSTDPFELVSLAVNCILAVYVLRQINTIDEGAKIEREVIINYFRSYEKDFIGVVKEFSSGGSKFTRVVALVKRYRLRLQKLSELAEEQGFIGKDSVAKSNAFLNLKHIQDFLTDTPRAGEIENGIRLEDGKLSFSDAQLDKITNGLLDFQNSCFCMIVEINRSVRK